MKKISIITNLILMSLFSVIFCMEICAKGWTNETGEWQYIGNDGYELKEEIKVSGEDKYYLDINGYMVRDYLLEEFDGATYYFDDDGKMVKNTWVAVEPNQVENQMDNAPTIYLYYFGASGKAFKAKSGIIKKTIDGKKYLFNENGQMLSGWINESGERYNEYDSTEDPFIGYCYFAGDETDGVLREGWCSYEDGSVDDRYYERRVIWFYFKPNDCKKMQSDDVSSLMKKKINGVMYAFDDNGVMATGWDSDAFEDKNTRISKNYFSENEDDIGRMGKKEWLFAVPSASQDIEEHDAEVEEWFYAESSGDVVKGKLKKINGSYYMFDHQGIMKTGLCVIDKSTKKYKDCIDIEKTDGKDFVRTRYYVSKGKDANGNEYYSAENEFRLFDDATSQIFYFTEQPSDEEEDTDFASLGKRKIGTVKVSFADDDYTFVSKNSGQYEGRKSNKYYQAGIELKADDTLGLGMVLIGYASTSDATNVSILPMYHNSTHDFANQDVNHKDEYGAYVMTDYVVDMSPEFCNPRSAYPVFSVVEKSGSKVKKANSVRKDKSGRYWLIGGNATLTKIFEVPIKYDKKDGKWYFKSEYLKGTGGDAKIVTGWIPFDDCAEAGENTEDVYGRRCYLTRSQRGDYELNIDETFALNFRFVD